MKKYLLLFPAVIACFHLAQSQQNLNITPGAPMVFLDCWSCDFDQFRNEINFVNFMKERQSANVFVMITGQSTGTSGRLYTFYFEGQKEFEGMYDTLTVVTENDNTFRERNNQLIAVFKKGILPFVLQSPIADKLTYTIEMDRENETGDMEDTAQITDPWNGWSFTISGGGYYSSETSYNNLNANMGLSVRHVTEKEKVSLSARMSYSESNFLQYVFGQDGNILDTIKFTSIRRSKSANGSYIYSLARHFSLGGFANVYENVWANLKFSTYARAGIEYNFFPYTESDKRELTISYKIGPTYNDYIDTTILNKKKELVGYHQLSVNLYQNQKWGSISFGISYSAYLNDLRLNRLSFSPNISWNIARGLTVNLGAYLSFINDQITLPKQSANVQNVLLRDRIIFTNYNFFGNFSLRYTFGSQFNNVVNTRFSGGGGGGSVVYFY
jgi:hypothetical protein